MKKAIAATKQHFESSSGRTPEYLSWHRLFRKQFTEFLMAYGATDIQIGSPNHFDMSGFFTLGSQAWYFQVGDLRMDWSKQNMLVRTAKHYKDYTGGKNEYVPMDGTHEDFEDGFRTLMTRYGFVDFQNKLAANEC